MIVLANTITVDVEYVDVTSFASTTKSLKVKCFVGDASPLSGSFAASLLSKLVHALPALEYFVEDTKRVPSPGSTLPTPKFFLYFFSCNRKTSAVSCAARESVYTAGYLGLGPVLTNKIKEANPGLGDLTASIAGSSAAGAAAA